MRVRLSRMRRLCFGTLSITSGVLLVATPPNPVLGADTSAVNVFISGPDHPSISGPLMAQYQPDSAAPPPTPDQSIAGPPAPGQPASAGPAPVQTVPAPRVDTVGLIGYLNRVAEYARATEPSWPTPLVTSTPLLERRLRFDLNYQQAGNGTNTILIDNGKGLDVIVGETQEVQFAIPPYVIRTGVGARTPKGTPIYPITGWGDWSFFRFKQRLLSSPSSGGDYIVTAQLQVQAPWGIYSLTSNAWTYTPSLVFGKGWGPFDIIGQVGAVIPASHTATLGHQIQTNAAFQYHVLGPLWSELEVNWTWWTDGQRGGLNQVFLTPAVFIRRIQFGNAEYPKLTLGFGYQVALAPDYRPKPLTPAFNRAFLFTSRLNF